ncbi:MAG TPA: DUF4349 domain-containing protein [Pyrinomonadaceae bacterium]|jgi:hypothetical protein
MKSLSFFLLLAVIFGQLGCYANQLSKVANEDAGPQAAKTQTAETLLRPVSLTQADSAETVAAAADRKIIKNAELTLEVASPTDAQRAIASITESHNGFVVTSETRQTENADPAKRTLEVKLIARVPANQFDAAVTAIEKLATNVIHRTISGNDVTEEFIDLEARIRTQKALELQFMQILKQAGKIADALEVQRQIADVRTEIEKLEGRKRFLENRASLSTITVEIKPPVVIAVSTTGFGRNLRESVSDSIDVASAIVLGLTRFVIVMIPIVVLIILPLGLVATFFVRRAKRIRLAETLNIAPVPE